jgi:outer membrane protein assembly factor BamA
MDDYFIPKMRYTYLYTSPTTLRNPIRWETTVEESGNAVALWDVLGGRGWNEKNKTLFKNPYSQFVKVETDLTKTWSVGKASTLVGHLNAGMLYYYGNSDDLPFSEMFYAGGANSIRAFTVRGVGPGAFSLTALGVGSRQFAYVMQNGDMKLVANLEYRPRLFGNLEGALFIDAGNVWLRKFRLPTLDDAAELGITGEEAEAYVEVTSLLLSPMVFHASKFFDQIAVGTGIGLRYDLGFLAIRLDWGLALHMPYDTGRSGYFNVNRFSDAHTLHFAVGYPF